MKKGLVLEGGALRGLFTAGVMDVLMEHGVTFDGLVGVSAGTCFALVIWLNENVLFYNIYNRAIRLRSKRM